MTSRLAVLTWHVHGNYLYYLSRAPHDFHLVTRPGDPPGYAGRVGDLPWPDNVHEVPEAALHDRRYDCVLYQSSLHFEHDRLRVLNAAERALPSIYLEHDPPLGHPSNTVHPAAGEVSRVVHVSDYNALMWDVGQTPSCVIQHGVAIPPGIRWSGERQAGVVVVNHLRQRGRRLGADLFEQAAQTVPLVLFGMDAQSLAAPFGAAAAEWREVRNTRLAAEMAHYRFFFHPARYTSMGLAVIEAMMAGLPIVGLATTELPSLIINGYNGWLDNRPERLIEVMQRLLNEPETARRWGQAARESAHRRFGIERFAGDWDRVLQQTARAAALAPSKARA